MGERIVRVLLIDDETSGSADLRDVMTHAGFEVITATDGWAGLEYVRQRRPDAVIWAQRAAGVGIGELQRLLQYDPTTSSIPCVSLAMSTAPPARAAPGVEHAPTPAEELIVRIHAALRRTTGDTARVGPAVKPAS